MYGQLKKSQESGHYINKIELKSKRNLSMLMIKQNSAIFWFGFLIEKKSFDFRSLK